MGATTFSTSATGRTATEAFNRAVSQALYDYGHNGYTGTIAEKSSLISLGIEKDAESAYAKAQKMIDEDDPRISDKWGPAGCLRIEGTDRYIFFGWASQ